MLILTLQWIPKARVIAVIIAFVGFPACSAHRATSPVPSVGQQAVAPAPNATSQGLRPMSVPPPSQGGCGFDPSDGSINCTSGCTGSWGTDGVPHMVCIDDGGGSIFGPSGGWSGGIGFWGNQTGIGGFDPNPNTSQMNAAQRMWNAAMKFKVNHQAKNSTLKLRGAKPRNECVASIQQILADSLLALIAGGTNYLPTFEAALPYSGYVQVTQDQAVAGDFVIEANDNHMGMCETNGCTMMISNSSSNESFTWETTPSAFAAYFHSSVRYWHHGN